MGHLPKPGMLKTGEILLMALVRQQLFQRGFALLGKNFKVTKMPGGSGNPFATWVLCADQKTRLPAGSLD